jgi:hypothetical protein
LAEFAVFGFVGMEEVEKGLGAVNKVWFRGEFVDDGLKDGTGV